MKLDVFLLTYNRKGVVTRCLSSLFRSQIKPDGETIRWHVLDNGSTDGTAEWLLKAAQRYPGITVSLQARNLGVAVGRAIQLTEATGDLVMLLDSDVEVFATDWAHPLLLKALEPEVGIVGAHGLFYTTTWQDSAPKGRTLPVDCVSGFCQVFRRSLLDEIEIDQDFNGGGHEDHDFCVQALAAGYTNWQVAPLHLRHDYAGTWNINGLLAAMRARFEQKWFGKNLLAFERNPSDDMDDWTMAALRRTRARKLESGAGRLAVESAPSRTRLGAAGAG